MNEISVRLFQPLRTNRLSPLLDAWSFARGGVSQVTWTTERSYGFADLTVMAPPRFSGLTLIDLVEGRSDIRPFAHVEVAIGDTAVWEGMLNGYKLAGLSIVGFTAIGYGKGLRHTPFAGSTGNALDVLKAMIRDEAPFMRLGPDSRVIDPQYTLQTSQVQNLRFNDLVALINKNGSARGYPLRCQVWADRTILIEPDIPPDIPRWQIPERGLQIGEPNLERLTGQVTVLSDSTSVTTDEEPTFQGRYQLRRQEVINIGSNADTSQLTAYGNAYLAANSRVRLDASWQGTDWLPTLGGTPLPAWTVQAGSTGPRSP